MFRISWLHTISFTYNQTASFFRHRIVQWPWVEFKMSLMLSKKSWNIFLILMSSSVQSDQLVSISRTWQPHKEGFLKDLSHKIFFTILGEAFYKIMDVPIFLQCFQIGFSVALINWLRDPQNRRLRTNGTSLIGVISKIAVLKIWSFTWACLHGSSYKLLQLKALQVTLPIWIL